MTHMQPKPWKTLKSTDILVHPRLHIIEDIVELPDGKTTSYVKHAPASAHSVAVIAVNDKQEILLQKEYSYPPNIVMWQLPGGKCNEGEDILVAANRELSEESDFLAKDSRVIGEFYVNNRRSDEKQYVVLCRNLVPQPGTRDAEEFIETHWVPIAKLKSMIKAGEFSNVNLLAALSMWLADTAALELVEL